jgi:hypothetical protein
MRISTNRVVQGFAIVEAVLNAAEVFVLAPARDAEPRSESCRRASPCTIRRGRPSPRTRAWLCARASCSGNGDSHKAPLFDKSPARNWLVAWHQDTAFRFGNTPRSPEWGPWSTKAGVTYAHAPASALAQRGSSAPASG